MIVLRCFVFSLQSEIQKIIDMYLLRVRHKITDEAEKTLEALLTVNNEATNKNLPSVPMHQLIDGFTSFKRVT